MDSRINKLYQNYVNSKLDLIFDRRIYLDGLKGNKPEELGENQIYDIDGKIIDVDSIGEFHDGYAVVKKTYSVKNQYSSGYLLRAINANYPHPDTTEYIKYNYINQDYQLYPDFIYPNTASEKDKTIDHWFDSARDFHYGIGVVSGYDHEWYVSKGWGMVGNTSFNKVYDFIGNAGLIMGETGYWFMDRTGHWPSFNVTGDHHTTIYEKESIKTPVNRCIHFVQGADRYSGIHTYINMNKSFILAERINTESGSKNNITYQVACTAVDLKDYIITKKTFGYELKCRKDKYNVNKEPIKIFDKRFTLCLDKKNIFLYDRLNKKSSLIGDVENTYFDDNLIVKYDEYGNIISAKLIYNEKELDVTEYYNSSLKGVENIKINYGIRIPTIEEFVTENAEYIVNAIKVMDTEEAAASYEAEKQAVKDSIQRGFETIDNKYSNNKERLRVGYDEILEPYNGHKRIKPVYLKEGYLKKLDLSNVSFNDVEMSGIDFSGCNIYFYPQKVYDQDLRGCNFEGVYFPVFAEFHGVDIRGAKFTNSGNPATFDINKEALSYGIYDEYTTLNGVPLVELLNKKRRSM